MGALLATMVRRRDDMAKAAQWLPRIAAMAAAAIIGVVLWDHPRAFGFWSVKVMLVGYSAVAVLAFCWIAAVTIAPPQSLMRRACEDVRLRWLGRYSYASYVLHFPLMVAIRDHLFAG